MEDFIKLKKKCLQLLKNQSNEEDAYFLRESLPAIYLIENEYLKYIKDSKNTCLSRKQTS